MAERTYKLGTYAKIQEIRRAGLTIHQISDLLGYSNPDAIYRANRRGSFSTSIEKLVNTLHYFKDDVETFKLITKG